MKKIILLVFVVFLASFSVNAFVCESDWGCTGTAYIQSKQDTVFGGGEKILFSCLYSGGFGCPGGQRKDLDNNNLQSCMKGVHDAGTFYATVNKCSFTSSWVSERSTASSVNWQVSSDSVGARYLDTGRVECYLPCKDRPDDNKAACEFVAGRDWIGGSGGRCCDAGDENFDGNFYGESGSCCSNGNKIVKETWYEDKDGDGYRSTFSTVSCTKPNPTANFKTKAELGSKFITIDCDDSSAGLYLQQSCNDYTQYNCPLRSTCTGGSCRGGNLGINAPCSYGCECTSGKCDLNSNPSVCVDSLCKTESTCAACTRNKADCDASAACYFKPKSGWPFSRDKCLPKLPPGSSCSSVSQCRNSAECNGYCGCSTTDASACENCKSSTFCPDTAPNDGCYWDGSTGKCCQDGFFWFNGVCQQATTNIGKKLCDVNNPSWTFDSDCIYSDPITSKPTATCSEVRFDKQGNWPLEVELY
jgi:hypothetical protein